ncbi:hypothetical protein D3C81_1880970 [compost metagenome]
MERSADFMCFNPQHIRRVSNLVPWILLEIPQHLQLKYAELPYGSVCINDFGPKARNSQTLR